MTEQAKTIIWLDWVRTIGIYLVVLGHLMLPPLEKNWIYAFHMPLFFFISGFLFNSQKWHNFSSFLIAKTRTLLWPYFFLNIVTYILWVIKMQVEPDSSVSIINAFFQIFYGGVLPHNTPLWFLMALFIVEIIVFVLLDKVNKFCILFIFVVLSWTTQYVGWVPFYIDAAIVGVPFYIAGYLYKDKIRLLLSLRFWLLVVIGILLTLLTLLLSQWNGRVDMFSNGFGANFSLFWLNAIVGIVLMFVLGKLCDRCLGNVTFIRFISRNTIIILALHITVIRLLKGPFILFGISSELWNNIWGNILIAVIVVLILYPIIFFINRNCPWMTGK